MNWYNALHEGDHPGDSWWTSTIATRAEETRWRDGLRLYQVHGHTGRNDLGVRVDKAKLMLSQATFDEGSVRSMWREPLTLNYVKCAASQILIWPHRLALAPRYSREWNPKASWESW